MCLLTHIVIIMNSAAVEVVRTSPPAAASPHRLKRMITGATDGILFAVTRTPAPPRITATKLSPSSRGTATT